MTRLGGEGTAPPIPHHLQYVIIRWVSLGDKDSTLVWGTENMSDGEVLAFVRRDDSGLLPPLAQRILSRTGKLPEGEAIVMERYDCCYRCLEKSPCRGIRGQQRNGSGKLILGTDT